MESNKRLLDGIELGLAISNEFSPFNVVCAVKIEGRLDPEKLRAALAAVQHKHPLLQARIVLEKGSYYYVRDGVGPVPLTIMERKSPDDWLPVTEAELDRRMEVAQGPMLRCCYLLNPAGEGESEIILSFNHTILDATSGLPLLREFVRACGEEAVDLGPEPAGESQFPATSFFPAKLSGFGYVRAVAAYMMRQMSDEMRYRWLARSSRKPVIKESGLNKIFPLVLSRGLTDALVRSTRRERITMNAILTAALMLAVKRHLYPQVDTPFRNITFADLRSYLRKPVPGSILGCFMGMCRFTVLMQDRPDFWRLAGEVQETIYRSNKRGERFLANALSPGMMKMIIGMKKIRMGTTAISYAGLISVDDSKGTFRIRGLHAFTTNMTIGPEFSALSRMFDNRIWLDLLYIDADMDSVKAGQIAEEMRLILEGAAATAGQPHPKTGMETAVRVPAV